MMCVRASLALLAVVSLLSLAPRAPQAAPAREALIIGNGTYGALPPLPACLQSAHAVAAALRGIGFEVLEREDTSTGGLDAALGDFSRRLTAAPGAAAVVYSCGYATSFNDRPFILPVSARIGRPADALTQGVLAKLLTDVVARGGAGAALVAIDTVPVPDAPAASGLEELAKSNLPAGLGLVAVSQAKPADTLTPLATALIAGLRDQEVQTTTLLATVQQRLAATPVTLGALRPPTSTGYLAGAPPPPPPPPVAPSPPPAQPAVATAPPTPPTPAPVIILPADELMTDGDRRTVQTALARLGYYPGPIDGLFGPDTRAAIRRFQHELGADMTGRLTAAQASRLASRQ